MSKSKGLGDTIENITKSTGIKKLVELVKGNNCSPCERRKNKLNELFPYKNSKPLEENNDIFKDGIYEIQKTTNLNINKENIIYKEGDRIFVNKENPSYNLFKKLYQLGVLKNV